jgi:hypothetical protein
MKRTLFTLAQVCLLVTVSANIVRAQNHTQTVSVTNVAANITADGNYNQILLRENSATPTAAFSITLAGSSTAINYPAGTQFLFSGNFMNGQIIGTIQATTAGPFTFIAVEASGPPSMSVKNTIINSGGGSMVYPGAGVPLSTGSAWGTSFTVGSAANNLVQLNGSAQILPSMLPSPSASTLGGVQSLSVVAHNFLTGISTSGVPSQAQPSFSDISGSLAASQLPNPSASTLGGIESLASTSHQWINAISTSGVPSSTQPAFSDISGTLGIGAGGTNATSAANALINLFPTASEVGDLVYCSAFSSGNCTAWSLLAGNTSGTKVLQETSSGVPSWVANGGGVSSFTGDGTVFNNSASTGGVTATLANAAQNSVLAGPATGGAGAPTYQTAPTISAANMTSVPACATCLTNSANTLEYQANSASLTLANNTSYWIGPVGVQNTLATTEKTAQIWLGRNITVTGIHVFTTVAQPASGVTTATFQQCTPSSGACTGAALSSTVSCAVTAGNYTCNSTGLTSSASAGNYIDVKFAQSGATGPTSAIWGVTVDYY